MSALLVHVHQLLYSANKPDGGGGTCTHKVYGKNMRRALKLNNFADIGATVFIFASFYS